MATVSEAIIIVKKHFDNYKKSVKSGNSATTQVRNYYNHFDKLVRFHGYDDNDLISDFFDEFITDDEFISEERMPIRWSPKTWSMSFESIIDSANILKDNIDNDKLQHIYEKANKYIAQYSNNDNIKEIDVSTNKKSKDTVEEDIEEEEAGDEGNFDFSNISKLFGNFGGNTAAQSKPDNRLEIMQNMMIKLASTEQDKWPNAFCETIAELLA